MVRRTRPCRLHRRVHRTDPRLVLHTPRPVRRAVRPAGVLQRDLSRRRAGPRRSQAVEEAAQLSGPGRGLRVPRFRRAALAPDVLAHPAWWRPAHRDRRVGLHRGHPPGDQPDLERILLLHPVRERGRPPRVVPHRRDRPVGPLRARQDLGPGRVGHRPHGRIRHRRCLRRRAAVPGCAQQLVHPPVPGTLLGARRRSCIRNRCVGHVAGQARRLRHPLHGADHAREGRRPAAPAGRRGDPPGSLRRRA